jgi:MFS family permease
MVSSIRIHIHPKECPFSIPATFRHNSTDEKHPFLVLFTVSNLVISDAFPPEVQSLAGGVFNEVSQFGNSVGLAITAAIAASITDHRSAAEEEEERAEVALMEGYRAAFWTIFAGTVVVVAVSALGLRHGGFVGKKND